MDFQNTVCGIFMKSICIIIVSYGSLDWEEERTILNKKTVPFPLKGFDKIMRFLSTIFII